MSSSVSSSDGTEIYSLKVEGSGDVQLASSFNAFATAEPEAEAGHHASRNGTVFPIPGPSEPAHHTTSRKTVHCQVVCSVMEVVVLLVLVLVVLALYIIIPTIMFLSPPLDFKPVSHCCMQLFN